MTEDPPIKNKQMARIRRLIVEWFAANGRELPWREAKNPYHILIAEMLLRRTTATAVLRVFPSFIDRFESIESLAAARQSSIEKQVESLGLQRARARHLYQTAKLLVQNHQATVPTSADTLASLPGIGRYSAAAIANFAFGKSVPMVDGNVVHLLNRIFGLKLRNPEDENAWSIMQQLGGPMQEKSLYWGIIDLVATICLRKNPRCPLCPLTTLCHYSHERSIH